MTRSLPICFLATLLVFAAYSNQHARVSATEPEATADSLKQRVQTLETQVNQLQQLVTLLQAEQLRDILPLNSASISGVWTAQTDSDQTIALHIEADHRCAVMAHGDSIGSVRGYGTWKLDGTKVIVSYLYEGNSVQFQTVMPLDVIAENSMQFAGVVYTRVGKDMPAARATAK
jgi:hypothetical protein